MTYGLALVLAVATPRGESWGSREKKSGGEEAAATE